MLTFTSCGAVDRRSTTPPLRVTTAQTLTPEVQDGSPHKWEILASFLYD